MNKTQQRPEADPAKDFSRFEGSKESAAFAFDAHFSTAGFVRLPVAA